ncbi:hypothetical protein ACFO7V_16760 [Glutamicibacter bergerei]|uniref:Uncharacterized protein n=1 Tax=Glutamicibacter bergerei TaxID=256702 RepID=A0ABV9MQA0_9MICC|nr:hypothetical protein [Micrococcaceae bacterium]
MTYRIEGSPLGTYALYLGQALIMQATSRAECVRVRNVLQDRGHAERVLGAVKYNAENNTIEDTP